jgi:NhaP-type Na+/H+ or K+/H+ antiporter/Trk K+ transport system NAD-binding subunit
MAHAVTALDTILISLIIGVLCLFVADRLRFPAILLFLGFGIGLGDYGARLISARALGSGLDIIVTAIVALILFEGGFSLDMRSLRKTTLPLIVQVLLTSVATFATAYFSCVGLLHMAPQAAAIFASLAIVTGPTVVKPIIMHLPLRGPVKSFLDGEAVLTDGLAAVVSVVLIEFFTTGGALGSAVLRFFAGVGAGAAIGVGMGFLVKLLVVRLSRAPAPSPVFLLLGALYLCFFASEKLIAGSGLICVTVFGLTLGTLDYRVKHELLSFKSNMTRMAIAFLFVLLASRFDLPEVLRIIVPGLAVTLVLVAVRFPVVLASTIRGGFSIGERLFISWMGPRGIVALSVAAIAAFTLAREGIGGVEELEPAAFILIAFTVSVQGLSAGFLARASGITSDGDGSLVILGINEATLAVSRLWRERQQQVLMIDSEPGRVRTAEKEGFACVLGNGLDSGSYEGVEIEDFDAALAATANGELNVLFCQTMKRGFGIRKTYAFMAERARDELLDVMKNSDIKFSEMYLDTPTRGGASSAVASFLNRILSRRPFSVSCTAAELGELSVPGSYAILSVMRGGSLHVYHGGFAVSATDRLLLITEDKKIAEALGGGLRVREERHGE